MSRIIKITVQKHHSDRFNCFLDSGERITVSADMIIRFGLSRDKDLSASERSDLEKEADYYFTREKALFLLSLRDHSSMELRRKLYQKGYNKTAIDASLAYLEEKNYLNDERFAAMYFRELVNIKHLGPLKIREKMYEKGVKKDILEPLLLEKHDEDWQASCKFHARKKIIHESDPRKYKEKMTRFLMGKGFSWQTIASVLPLNT